MTHPFRPPSDPHLTGTPGLQHTSVIRSSNTPMVLHARVVSGTGGGPDKTILRSPRYAESGDLRMSAVYLHPHGDPGIQELQASARRQGCSLWEVPETGPFDPRAVRDLIRLCRKLRVTIWHGHDYKTNFLGLLLRCWHPMKLVTTVHGWTRETRRTRAYYHVDQWCIPHYEQVITVSRDLFDHCRGIGVKPDRLTYISNAIELDDYRRTRTRDERRAEMGVPRDKTVIGVVGRLSREKGVDRAIEALVKVRGDRQNAELHVIGDGPDRERLGSLAGELGVGCCVRFWGWQRDLKPFYEMMDMLLVPSHTEGLPNAVLEAMAMQVPVSGTGVGGVPELLDHGRCGMILDPSDTTRWGDQITGLLTDRFRQSVVVHLASRRVEERYSFRERMKQVMSVYDRVRNRKTAIPLAPMRRAA